MEWNLPTIDTVQQETKLTGNRLANFFWSMNYSAKFDKDKNWAINVDITALPECNYVNFFIILLLCVRL